MNEQEIDRLNLCWALMASGRVGLVRGYATVSVFSQDAEMLLWLKFRFGGSVVSGPKTKRWEVSCKKARVLLAQLPRELCSERLRQRIDEVLLAPVGTKGQPRKGW